MHIYTLIIALDCESFRSRTLGIKQLPIASR